MSLLASSPYKFCVSQSSTAMTKDSTHFCLRTQLSGSRPSFLKNSLYRSPNRPPG